MRFLSVCSGIEAASVAWHPLCWRAWAFSEIDPFASAVLAHHYPATPNLGDMTKFRDWPDAAFDVLVGGTPCQSFSVAGLRKGLADPRGNLSLVYLAILDRYRPRWVVWENVPGVLSSGGGRDFGAFLGGLAQLGYGFAYRVLDAQFFGLAQRRKRVFVVGHARSWRHAAAVLFEPESLSGHPPPGDEARESPAATITASAGERGANSADAPNFVPLNDLGGVAHALTATATATATGHLDPTTQDLVGVPMIAGTMPAAGGTERKHDHGWGQQELESGYCIPLAEVSKRTGQSSTSLKAGDGIGGTGDPMFTLGADSRHGVAIAFDETQITSATNRCNPQPGDPCHPLARGARPPTLAFHARQDPDSGPVTHPLDTDGGSIDVMTGWRVRRLTPVECERLQGFPDGYTMIPMSRGTRRKVEDDFAAYLRRQHREQGWPEPTDEELARLAADGPRYRVLGNSMAVPVMRWIGEGIAAIDALTPTEAIRCSATT